LLLAAFGLLEWSLVVSGPHDLELELAAALVVPALEARVVVYQVEIGDAFLETSSPSLSFLVKHSGNYAPTIPSTDPNFAPHQGLAT
jgi:hypothetical protein